MVEVHVDSRDSRVKRDNIDVNKLVEGFKLHDPFSKTTHLILLVLDWLEMRKLTVTELMKSDGINVEDHWFTIS